MPIAFAIETEHFKTITFHCNSDVYEEDDTKNTKSDHGFWYLFWGKISIENYFWSDLLGIQIYLFYFFILNSLERALQPSECYIHYSYLSCPVKSQKPCLGTVLLNVKLQSEISIPGHVQTQTGPGSEHTV